MPPDSVQKPEIIGDCHDCGREIEECDELRGIDDELYCDECYNNRYTGCENCGDTIESEYASCDRDGYPYCECCWENRRENVDLNSFDNSLSVYNPPEITTFERNKFETKLADYIYTLMQEIYIIRN